MAKIVGIIFVILLGILAGGQLGKIAPIIERLQQEREYSLFYLGWLTSLIGFFVAVAALPTGIFIKRFGSKQSLYLGAGLMFAGGLLLASGTGQVLSLVARGIEAAGYVLVVIAAPAVLNILTTERTRAPALALWGGFVPVGFALANFQAEIVLTSYGVDVFFFSMAIALGIVAILLFSTLRHTAVPIEPFDSSGFSMSELQLSPKVLFLAAGFGLYVVVSIAFFTFLPSFLNQLGSRVLLSAAAIALLVPIGNIAASVLVAGRMREHAMAVLLCAFVVGGLSGICVFILNSPAVIIGAAVINAISGGVMSSLIFACVPKLVVNGMSASVVLGVIAQAGGIGTVVGPPIAALVLQSGGWTGLGLFICIVSLVGGATILAAKRSGA